MQDEEDVQSLIRLYRKIYAKSPKRAQGWMTRMVASLPHKPTVKKSPVPFKERFPGSCAGALVISADFEMGWAWRFAKTGQDPVAMGLKERANISPLLELFETYEIPVTWATVGHLFLEKCTRKNNKAHPDLSRIPHFTNAVWRFDQGDWYDHDPCTDVHRDPAWYGPDLIRMIQRSSIPHEIGCHTFSHLDCTDGHCPPAVLKDELEECARAAEPFGVFFKSMVFPGGTNGNYQVLKDMGYTNYRINSLWDLFYPEKDKFGLWRLPSTESIDNHGFGWSPSYYEKYYRRYMDKAIDTGTCCHLWFHPCIDEYCLEKIFPKVLAYARKRADQGELWIATMDQAARFCEERFGK